MSPPIMASSSLSTLSACVASTSLSLHHDCCFTLQRRRIGPSSAAHRRRRSGNTKGCTLTCLASSSSSSPSSSSSTDAESGNGAVPGPDQPGTSERYSPLELLDKQLELLAGAESVAQRRPSSYKQQPQLQEQPAAILEEQQQASNNGLQPDVASTPAAQPLTISPGFWGFFGGALIVLTVISNIALQTFLPRHVDNGPSGPTELDKIVMERGKRSTR
eukprot:jgi/Chlat1/5201/Chrsp33S05176